MSDSMRKMAGHFLPEEDRAIVIFKNSSHPWLQWLKPGFQHCAVLIKADGYSVLIDGGSRGIDIRVSERGLGELNYLAGKEEITLVPTRRYKHTTRHKVPHFLTCVSLTKKILGIRNFWIFTPYQLHQHLTK